MTTLPSLSPFAEPIARWFTKKFADTTSVQEAAWPVIARGEHCLATAPTGSGKTLTAFLWALNQFATGAYAAGATRVLYISPLKALNNDIQRNLIEPLAELNAAGDFPALRVATRSGDTSSGDRQRLLRRPPEILITTPESFALMLSTQNGQQALSTVDTLILDEIHGVIDNRRGVQLMTSVERLALIAGEFQRIVLSATITPMAPIAAYVAGRTPNGKRRPITIINAAADKHITFAINYPPSAKEAIANGEKIWEPLAQEFKTHVARNQSTLFFTNSRRLAEKITLKINDTEPQTLAYAHHGSLAREIRVEVEQRLKGGELKAIVATNSLEMGIDIGSLDEVVMVQTPLSVASALQRIGRAGHQVGATSRGTLYPTHANDFLESAVLADCVARRDIEPITPMQGALDVLAQVIISITAFSSWTVDELFTLIRCSGPYETLSREQFDLLTEMLAGRYAGSRIRELKPRITFDRITGDIQALRGAVLAMYSSGGTIPNRGYFNLRHQDSGAVIGELDEEFVWEATIGDTFTLGTQAWQVQRITHNDVLVRKAPSGSIATPFWRAESVQRSWHFSQQIGEYLERCEQRLSSADPASIQAELEQERGFNTTAATELVDYLTRQREATQSPLPHRHLLIAEETLAGPGGYRGPADIRQTVLHTFWGGEINRPWAVALTAAWHTQYPSKPEIFADNNAIVIQHQGPLKLNELLLAVTADNLMPLLRSGLESSGFFGARFRECAGRALLLTRSRFNQRLPLWMSRMQAKKLMTAVSNYTDFPVLLETWRTCLQDEFDLPTLTMLLEELHAGDILWQQVTTNSPSPFAADLSYGNISEYMYADDTPDHTGKSALDDDVIRLAVQGVTQRPVLDANIVAEFVAKRQRSAEGYEPNSVEDRVEWTKECLLIPTTRWPSNPEADQALAGKRLALLVLGTKRWVCHLEFALVLQQQLAPNGQLLDPTTQAPISATDLPNLNDARSATQLALEILSFYGPLSDVELADALPSTPPELAEADALISGPLLADDPTDYLCDAENYEILLRFQRAARRSALETLAVERWPGFVASIQKLGGRYANDATKAAQVMDSLEQLRGFSAPLTVWLNQLLPARFANLPPHLLDQSMMECGLQWLGTGRETITLLYPEEHELLQTQTQASPLAEHFNDPQARYEYFAIADQSGLVGDKLSELWWDSVWAGQLSADSLTPLRQGLLRKFAMQPVAQNMRRRRLGNSRGWPGNWQLTPLAQTDQDSLSELEVQKDQARLLLDRYGVISRELANREGGNLRWAKLFKALRIMELSGEIIAGYFFAGMSGPQFCTPQALGVLRRYQTSLDKKQDNPTHHWLSAADPASPCGLGLSWDDLPSRRVGNYLSFHAAQLALVIHSHGKRLQFLLPADHPDLDEVCAPLLFLCQQRKRIQVEEINNEPVATSEYLPVLERILSAQRDHKHYSFELPRG